MKTSHLIVLFIFLMFISCKSKINETNKELVDKAVTINEKPANKAPKKVIKPSKSFNHIEHIRNNSRKGETDGITEDPEYFVDYVIQNLLEKPEYKKYITDRNLLRKLRNEVCWDNYVLIRDVLSNGDECEIEIKLEEFTPEEHEIKYEEESGFLVEVDGKYPFGAIYAGAETALKSIRIKINDEDIYTKVGKYNNLYNLELCNFGSFQRIAEAYEDGDNIYVYMHGGNAAGSYFIKLIFDKSSGYITSIITDYVPLSMYGSFTERFIGY